MGETKKIIIEHFPVQHLPEELRKLLASTEPVRITIEQAADEGARRLPAYGFAQAMYNSRGLDPVEYIRQLRDEWPE